MDIPEQLRDKLREHGQDHVLRWWDQLSDAQRQHLVKQLQAIDLERIEHLFHKREEGPKVPPLESIQPVPFTRLDPADQKTLALGEEALRQGRVAALVVAGGQGTRLGFDDPKGMFEIGPVSGKTLFQIFAEKILALQRRYGKRLPLLVMTSDATDDKTRDFFSQKNYFGLSKDDVHFFCQGTMPAVDWQTGKLLMAAPDQICRSPNGHGGVLPALKDAGLLHELQSRGIHHLFYFQVDNPLVKIADPLFLGHHILHKAEASTKALPKQEPLEKVGNLAMIDGKCSVIEYSDLPRELAEARDEHGKLRFSLGNLAIHIFDVDFLRRVSEDLAKLPFHIAKKKVPHISEHGEQITPQKENACKFEMFIFDILPLAARWTVVEISVPEEYAPLKNAKGAHSPDEVRRAISRLAHKWLQQAGATVQAKEDDVSQLEVSPLFALDEKELAKKVSGGETIVPPAYLE